jgi:superfamily II DNA or RNA helicase
MIFITHQTIINIYMNILTKYQIDIYEKWSLIKDTYNETKDNKLIAKIFEYYTCIKLTEEYKRTFYEYGDIDSNFKEENKLTQNDSGIDCCDLKNTIVQCKLRSNNLTWGECATFFASAIIYNNEKNKKIIKWNNLIIARNSNSKLSKNLKFKNDLFDDKTYDLNEFIDFCDNLLINNPIYPEVIEQKLVLRDYQTECVNKIKKSDKNFIVNLPTGTGKNVIIINSLETDKKYLILVPRIILMEQIENEIIKFNKKLLSKIQCIGDNNNIYDNKKLITICVYNSIDKITNIDSFNKIFIDEAHHIKTPQIYCNDKEDGNKDDENENEDEDEDKENANYLETISKLSKYNNNVYLSATIDEIKDFNYYTKDIRNMINLKYLCDYQINIPIFDNDITNNNICWHLIRKYSNIIIYCSNQKEGKLINKTLNKLIPSCSDYVDCNTTKSKRNNIIKKYKEGKLTFLVNVKILVEGFDAPITKGVCFIHLPSSKTTLIQIIGRALRLHPLKTIANIILPCSTNDDGKSINNFLKIMARNDTRIKKSFENKTLGGYINLEKVDNNKSDDNTINDNKSNDNIIEARYEMIYDSLGILKNNEEIWNYKLNILFDFVNKKKRVPTNKEIYRNVDINTWLGTQKRNINSNNDELYKKLSSNKIIKINLDEYLIKKELNKDKKINSFDESLKIFMDYVEKNNNIPIKKEYSGQWFQDRKKKITTNKDELYIKLSKNIIVKDNLDNYLKNKETYTKILSFDESFKLFNEYIKENDKIPIKSEKYKNVNIGRWFGTQKSKINSIEDETYKKLNINTIIKNNLDEYLKTKKTNENKEKLSYEDNLKILIEFIEKNNRVPTRKEQYKDINISSWLSNQKTKISSKNDDLYKKLSTNQTLKANLDEYLNNKKVK